MQPSLLMPDFDVVVVGASLAGCATGDPPGRAGHRVALVEKRPDPAAYKRVCGHFVQSSAVPALARLDVLEELEAAGAARGHARVWSPYGWFGEPDGAGPRASLSVRREKLDPLLRRRAAETPGVELMLGHALTGTSAAPGGRRVELSNGPELTTRLLVGADGRGSRTAALAGVRTRTSPNARFAYWGYFEGPPLGTGASVHIWFCGRDIGIATPTDGGLMLYVAFPGRERAKAFKADIEGELRAFIGALPDAPPIAGSRLAGPLMGKLDLTNEWRNPAGVALALVGDAALAADPVGAVGCGWAGSVGRVAGRRDLAGSARRAAAHRGAAGLPSPASARAPRALADGRRRAARGGAMPPPQRLLFAAAVHDPATARARGPTSPLGGGPPAHAAVATGARARRGSWWRARGAPQPRRRC